MDSLNRGSARHQRLGRRRVGRQPEADAARLAGEGQDVAVTLEDALADGRPGRLLPAGLLERRDELRPATYGNSSEFTV